MSRPTTIRNRRTRIESLERRLALTSSLAVTQPFDGSHEAKSWFATFESSNSFEFAGAAGKTSVLLPSQADVSQTALPSRWVVSLADEVVAGLAAGTDLYQLLALHNSGTRVSRSLGAPGLILIESYLPETELLQHLAGNPLVLSLEPAVRFDGQAVPNDPGFGQLEGLQQIRAESAWDLFSQNNLSIGSSSVVVGVLDTGIDVAHRDLYLNIWLNQGEIPASLAEQLVDVDDDGRITFWDLNDTQNESLVFDQNQNGYVDAKDLLADSRWADGFDDDTNSFIDDLIGWDFLNNDNDPSDDHRHGTHVAGTIAAIGNNGLDSVGVNWRSSLMALKVLDETNRGSSPEAIAAINYATMLRLEHDVNVRVTNNSFVGTEFSPAMQEAIARGADADILFVAAAGNGDIFGEGIDIDDSPRYPASYDVDNILSVTATNIEATELASFANFGACSVLDDQGRVDCAVDIAAPGVGILSTKPQPAALDMSSPSETTASRNGTSMAAPHVAGVAALIFAHDPAVTAREAREAILSSVQPSVSLQGRVASGGTLDARAALEALQDTPTATLLAADSVTDSNQSPLTITVKYESNDEQNGIDFASLDDADLVVTRLGFAGPSLAAEFQSACWDLGPSCIDLPPQDAGVLPRVVQATYRLQPPARFETLDYPDTWHAIDNGRYRIALNSGAVRNGEGVGNRATILTQSGEPFSFEVQIADPSVVFVDTLNDSLPNVFNQDLRVSLRTALQIANSAGVPITVVLPPGTYTLSQDGVGEDTAWTGDLDIHGDVTVLGEGQASTQIDAGKIDRVFHVHPEGSLQLHGVSVLGGAADEGAGIKNEGNVTISRSAIVGNTAVTAGGGIWNGQRLEILESTIDRNAVTSPLGTGGGGIYNVGDLAVDRTTISNNLAAGGFLGNGGGGGVYSATESTHDVQFVNSTISGNRATSGHGGGIHQAVGLALLRHVTVTQNSAVGLGGGIKLPDDPFSALAGLANSIVAGNTAAADPDVAGRFVPLSTNLVGIMADPPTSANQLWGTPTEPVDARLGPLIQHTGPTNTHVPLPDSPAINATYSANPQFDVDQRGVPRPASSSVSRTLTLGAVQKHFAEIRGRVFHDVDGDGERGFGEPQLANWIVYVDANNNGKLDTGEPSTLTRLDDLSTPRVDESEFVITELDPHYGDVAVRTVPREGFVDSTPLVVITNGSRDGLDPDPLPYVAVVEPTAPQIPVFHLDFTGPARQLTDVSRAQLPIEVGSAVTTIPAAGPRLENGRQLDAGRWAGANDDSNQILLLDHPTLDQVSRSAGSIVTWIKVDDQREWNGIIITRCDNAAPDKTNCDQFSRTRGLEFESNSQSGVFGSVQGWTTNNFGPRHGTNGGLGGTETPTGVWTHVALTWNDVGDHTIYVNGVKGRTITGVGPDPFGLNEPRDWSIGGDNVPLNSTFLTPDANSRRLRGELADFAIFKGELDGQLINDIIRNGVPTPVEVAFHLDFSQPANQLADASDQGLAIRVGNHIETVPSGGPRLETGVVLDSGRWADIADAENQIDVLDNAKLDAISGGAGTIVTWVKVENDDDWNSIVTTNCGASITICDASNAAGGIDLQADRETVGGVWGTVYRGSPSSFGPQRGVTDQRGGTETPANVWTHIALTWNDRGDQTIYVNGVPGGRVSGVGTDTMASAETGDWVIGGDAWLLDVGGSDQNQRYLHGELADLAILDGALDRRAINDIRRFGVPRKSNPVFHLDFSDSTIADAASQQLPIVVGAAVTAVPHAGPNLPNGRQLDAGRWAGVNDDSNQIKLLDHPDLDRVSRSAGTIVTWIKVDDELAWNGIVKTACADHARTCDTIGPERGIELASASTGGVFGAAQGWDTPAFGPDHRFNGGSGGVETPADTWTHLALTWDEDGSQTLFVNGQPGTTTTRMGPFGVNQTGDWTIGGDGLHHGAPDSDENGRRLEGELADFALFDRKLHPREVQTVMSDGVHLFSQQNTVVPAVRSLSGFDSQPSIVGNRIVFEDHLGRLQLTDGDGAITPLVGLNTVSTEHVPFADGEAISYDGEFVAFSGRVEVSPSAPKDDPTTGIFVVNQFGAFQELVNQNTPAPGENTFVDKSFEVLSISNELVAFGVRNTDVAVDQDGAVPARGVNDQGLYAAIASGGVRVLVDATTEVPGHEVRFQTFGDALLEETSFLAFDATYEGGFGIFQKRGIGPLETVVDQTTRLPNGVPLEGIESFAFSGGEIAFLGTSLGQQAIYLSNDEGLSVVVDSNTSIPADEGSFHSFGELAFDKGNVVFIGHGRSAEEAIAQGRHAQQGVYVSLDGRIEKVADLQPDGQPAVFNGRSPVELAIGPQAISGTSVVFYAAFADGTDGIFRVEFDSQSRHDITLTPGAVIREIEFGRRAGRGEIRGQSYNDINRNGRRDPDEPGLPGWTVFLDEDGDGQLDPGEASTNTGETGSYRFTDLPTLRHYRVRQLSQENWVASESFGSQHEFFLDADQTVEGIDFGNRTTLQIDGQGGNGRIRVVVFADANGNGVHDTDELVANATDVYLDVNNNGVFDPGLDSEPVVKEGLLEFSNLAMTSHEIRLRRNEGFEQTTPLGNSFEFVTQTDIGDRPTAVVAGRFDQDAFVDLIVGNNISNTLSLVSNAASPHDGATATIDHGGIGPIAIAAEDYNGDGNVDIAVANFHSSDVSILFGNGMGTFLPPVIYPIGESSAPVAITTANLNDDALPDLIVSNSASDSVTLMTNSGDGRFSITHLTAGVGDKPQGIVAGQLNDDGLDDLVVVSQRDRAVTVLLSTQDGGFAPQPQIAVGDRPSAIVAGDFDRDDHLDVAVANIGSSSVSVLFGDGTGAFPRRQQIRVDAPPIALSEVDIDGDADLDLVFTRSGDFPVSLLRNDGSGRFQSSAFSGATDFLDKSALPFSLAVSDVNGDAEVDLILASRDDNSITVLENKVVSGSHRVALRTDQPEQEVSFGIRLSNRPPTFELATAHPLDIFEDSGIQVMQLAGIHAGAGEQQHVRFLARSSNEGLVGTSGIQILHENGSDTAELFFTPTANEYGLTTITVELADAGFDQRFDTADDAWTTRSFDVRVTAVNDVPSFELRFIDDANPQGPDPTPISLNSEQTAFRVELLVSAGANEAQQPLSIGAVSSNPAVVPGFLRQSFDAQNSRGALVYAVNTTQMGTATITVVLEDGGLDFDLNTPDDNASTTHRFLVSVVGPRIPGDANLDGRVDIADFWILVNNFGTTNVGWEQADFDRSGTVNVLDFLTLSEHFGKHA